MQSARGHTPCSLKFMKVFVLIAHLLLPFGDKTTTKNSATGAPSRVDTESIFDVALAIRTILNHSHALDEIKLSTWLRGRVHIDLNTLIEGVWSDDHDDFDMVTSKAESIYVFRTKELARMDVSHTEQRTELCRSEVSYDIS
ncbi:hypothetical protein EVAR_103393_1 [Eumeta japonica]|uniref:Uncharacterized protein n=1 Tax=Eumeta variegata TaxID=151549 RepID=A0A4C1YV77_EUMVA|nr:hypothetical protein EVAR_103393_1 [Eumeta japonica]